MDISRTPMIAAATVSVGLILVGITPAQAQCSPQEMLKLKAADGTVQARFGASVDISGDTAIIGANLDDVGVADNGSAYIYRKVAGTWQQIAKLLADDGEALDNFGNDVAIDGSTAIVGAPFDADNGEASGSALYLSGDRRRLAAGGQADSQRTGGE